MCDMCIKLHLEDFFGIKNKVIVGNPHRKVVCKNYSPVFRIFFVIFIFILFVLNIIFFKYLSKK